MADAYLAETIEAYQLGPAQRLWAECDASNWLELHFEAPLDRDRLARALAPRGRASRLCAPASSRAPG